MKKAIKQVKADRQAMREIAKTRLIRNLIQLKRLTLNPDILEQSTWDNLANKMEYFYDLYAQYYDNMDKPITIIGEEYHILDEANYSNYSNRY